MLISSTRFFLITNMQENKKSVLITGANRGIGYEIARQLGIAGFHVFVTARNKEKGERALKNLEKENIDCEFLLLDVADFHSIKKAYELISQKIKQLDVLINNAGIGIDKSNILNADFETIHQTLNTNAIGALLVTQIFSPLLKSGSRVINVTSGLGSICNGMSGYSPVYSISKTTMNAITCQLSRVFEGKVAVNSVCPGWVRTDMGGPGAHRSVEKGAETIVWLAADASFRLTGKNFRDKQEIGW